MGGGRLCTSFACKQRANARSITRKLPSWNSNGSIDFIFGLALSLNRWPVVKNRCSLPPLPNTRELSAAIVSLDGLENHGLTHCDKNGIVCSVCCIGILLGLVLYRAATVDWVGVVAGPVLVTSSSGQ